MCIGKSWPLKNVPFHHIDPPSMVNSKRARARKDTKKAYVIIFKSRPRSRDKVRKTRNTVATWGSRHGLQKRTGEGHTSLEYMPQTESLIYFSMSMHPCFTYSCGNVCQSWPHKLDHSWKSTTKNKPLIKTWSLVTLQWPLSSVRAWKGKKSPRNFCTVPNSHRIRDEAKNLGQHKVQTLVYLRIASTL